MKILAVSDVTAKYYFDFFAPGKLDGFDLILACGDLSREYLEFLVTMANCTLLYVHGNHDERFDISPPQGCICVDGDICVIDGVRILGLGGSHRYRDGKHMYSEKEMRRRIRRLWLKIYRHRGFDILLTHAPARHINDFDTIAHRGFQCFVDLVRKYNPKYFIHGHIHQSYGINIPQRTTYESTIIINAYDHCVFEF